LLNNESAVTAAEERTWML